MQPRKSIGRAIEENSKVPYWNIKNSNGYLLSKETFGPKTESEYFNPVKTLLTLGYPQEKIKLLATVRDPLATYSSCTRLWGEIDVDNFERAYTNTLEVVSDALSRGVDTIFYYHEAINDFQPETVVNNLHRSLGVPTSLKAVNWTDSPRFGDTKSHIVFYDSPPEKFIRGVKTANEYAYHHSETRINNNDVNHLSNSRVFEIYDYFRAQSRLKLKLEP